MGRPDSVDSADGLPHAPAVPSRVATFLVIERSAVRWCVRSRLSYADVVEWLTGRRVEVDWSRVYCWPRRLLSLFGKAARAYLRPAGGKLGMVGAYCHLDPMRGFKCRVRAGTIPYGAPSSRTCATGSRRSHTPLPAAHGWQPFGRNGQ